MALRMETPQSLRVARTWEKVGIWLLGPGALSFLLTGLFGVLKDSSFYGLLVTVSLTSIAIGAGGVFIAWYIKKHGRAELVASLGAVPGVVSETILVHEGEDTRMVALLEQPGRFVVTEWDGVSLSVLDYDKSDASICVLKRQYASMDTRTGGEKYRAKVAGGLIGGAIGATIAGAVTAKNVRVLSGLTLEITLKDRSEGPYRISVDEKEKFVHAENICNVLAGTIVDGE